MSERRRRRADEDPGGARPTPHRRDLHDSPAEVSIRDLQRRAGNHAVAALLASSGAQAGSVQVQRDADERSSSPATMAIPELDLEIEISSFSRSQGGRQRRRDAESGEDDAGDFQVTFPLSAAAARLSEAAAQGKSFDTVTIKLGATATITLTSVFVSSLMIGDQVVSLTLSARSVDFRSGG